MDAMLSSESSNRQVTKLSFIFSAAQERHDDYQAVFALTKAVDKNHALALEVCKGRNVIPFTDENIIKGGFNLSEATHPLKMPRVSSKGMVGKGTESPTLLCVDYDKLNTTWQQLINMRHEVQLVRHDGHVRVSETDTLALKDEGALLEWHLNAFTDAYDRVCKYVLAATDPVKVVVEDAIKLRFGQELYSLPSDTRSAALREMIIAGGRLGLGGPEAYCPIGHDVHCTQGGQACFGSPTNFAMCQRFLGKMLKNDTQFMNDLEQWLYARAYALGCLYDDRQPNGAFETDMKDWLSRSTAERRVLMNILEHSITWSQQKRGGVLSDKFFTLLNEVKSKNIVFGVKLMNAVQKDLLNAEKVVLCKLVKLNELTSTNSVDGSTDWSKMEALMISVNDASAEFDDGSSSSAMGDEVAHVDKRARRS